MTACQGNLHSHLPQQDSQRLGDVERASVSTNDECVGNGILCIHKKTKYSHFQHHGGGDWKTVNEIGSSTENESPHEICSCSEKNSDFILQAGQSRTQSRECIGQWAQ